MFAIYGLYDPVEGRILYVGQTSADLKTRLRAHLSHAKTGLRTSPVCQWINQLDQHGVRPGIKLLEESPTEDLLDGLEKEWILSLREAGVDLLNRTKGGSSWPAGPEYREAASLRMKNQPMNINFIRAGQAARRGVPMSAEHKAKISQALKGNTNCVGRHHSEATKRKISQTERMTKAYNV